MRPRKIKSIHFRSNADLFSALDYLAEKHNTTTSAIIRSALYDYLKRQGETELPHPIDGTPVPIVYTEKKETSGHQ